MVFIVCAAARSSTSYFAEKVGSQDLSLRQCYSLRALSSFRSGVKCARPFPVGRGWLTEESADRYDTQVEVLFKGTANAMRRQALPPLAEAFAGHDQRRLQLIDIGCGTGRVLDFVKQVWPRLPTLGLDLSEAYIRHARRHLKPWSHTHLIVANAEAIPRRTTAATR